MADRELAQKVLTQITEHPELHNQRYWARRGVIRSVTGSFCGTAMCVAGWAVHLGDPAAVPLFAESSWGTRYAMEVMLGDGETAFYSAAGRSMLEISEEEAGYLFDESCTTDEVVNGLRSLIDSGSIDVPDEYGDSYGEEEDEEEEY